jgi:hypothetical protein
VSLIQVAMGLDYRDLDAVHEADRVYAHLAVVEAVIGPLHGRSVENPHRIPKTDTVPTEVFRVLGRIPREPHPGSIRYVFTGVEM